jgi:hypothetical protein
MPAPAAALLLVAAAGMPFGLPAPPGPDEGYAAIWAWLRAVNSELSIPDIDFRWKFGGFSIPILLLFELVGIRKDWKLYPFLLPFWLAFGSIAFGVVGGLAATAAHLVLFPVGRIWFMARDRRRAREVRRAAPAVAPPPPPPARRPAQDILRAAIEAIRTGAEQRRGARPAVGVPGQAPEPTWGALLRALGSALSAAAAARTAEHGAERPPPPPPAAERPSEATGASPRKPDLSAFRPDLSRFRRRPPQR